MKSKKIDQKTRISAVVKTVHQGILKALRDGGCVKDQIHAEVYEVALLLAAIVITGNGHLEAEARKHNTVAFCGDLAMAINDIHGRAT